MAKFAIGNVAKLFGYALYPFKRSVGAIRKWAGAAAPPRAGQKVHFCSLVHLGRARLVSAS